MCSLHPPGPIGPTTYACAQRGCQACLEQLLCFHEPLVHLMVQRQCRWGMDYTDLVQEGRIILWRAILRYHPTRGTAFSTYACIAIQRRVWRVLARFNEKRRRVEKALTALDPPEAVPDPADLVESAWLNEQLRDALHAACQGLPDRLRQAVDAYGLDGHSEQTLRAVGAALGYTGERVRQWRQDALVVLRLPACSDPLRALCGFATRTACQRTQALSRQWLRRRHPEPHRTRSRHATGGSQ
jgi:RNA polymerase sigma factor (sigma-70 family)